MTSDTVPGEFPDESSSPPDEPAIRWAESVSWMSGTPGRVLITSIDTFDLHVLQGTAALIWGRCDGSRSRSAIVRDTLAELSVTSSAADDECAAFLDALRASRLIEYVPSGRAVRI